MSATDDAHLRRLLGITHRIAALNGPIPPLFGRMFMMDLAIIMGERGPMAASVLDATLALIEALRNDITA